ncbi:hypothetical protein B0H14DRAFT_2615605 [Mycena olivaceomarginata]|nr:hypothetical protein B0H14DRAFT_2615605 [Mycena olivaceomarginata]
MSQAVWAAIGTSSTWTVDIISAFATEMLSALQFRYLGGQGDHEVSGDIYDAAGIRRRQRELYTRLGPKANPPFEWSRHRTAKSWMTRYRNRRAAFEKDVRKYQETLPIAARNDSASRSLSHTLQRRSTGTGNYSQDKDLFLPETGISYTQDSASRSLSNTLQRRSTGTGDYSQDNDLPRLFLPETGNKRHRWSRGFTDCMLYGIYIVTCGIAGRRLLTTDSGRWKRRSEILWVMLVVSIFLFVNATLDVVVATITLLDAFVFATANVLSHSSGWQTLTKAFCVVFQSLLGDAVLIYRCWFLWNKSWAVITLSLLIWFANIACAMRFLYLKSRMAEGLPWFEAFWSMTISINIITTSLIIIRIWIVERQSKKFRAQAQSFTSGSGSTHVHQPPTALSLAMRNIIESGMIYTIASILQLALQRSNIIFIVSALELHSVGIAFNLIIIRGAQVTRDLQPQDTVVSLPVQFSSSHTTGTHRSISRRGESDGVLVLTQIEKESGGGAAAVSYSCG